MIELLRDKTFCTRSMYSVRRPLQRLLKCSKLSASSATSTPPVDLEHNEQRRNSDCAELQGEIITAEASHFCTRLCLLWSEAFSRSQCNCRVFCRYEGCYIRRWAWRNSESHSARSRFVVWRENASKRDMFGDLTWSNLVWWPNRLIMSWVTKRLHQPNEQNVLHCLIKCLPSFKFYHTWSDWWLNKIKR